MKMNQKLLACLVAGGMTLMTADFAGMTAYATAGTESAQQAESGIAFYGAKELKEVPLSSIKSPNENPFGLVY